MPCDLTRLLSSGPCVCGTQSIGSQQDQKDEMSGPQLSSNGRGIEIGYKSASGSGSHGNISEGSAGYSTGAVVKQPAADYQGKLAVHLTPIEVAPEELKSLFDRLAAKATATLNADAPMATIVQDTHAETKRDDNDNSNNALPTS